MTGDCRYFWDSSCCSFSKQEVENLLAPVSSRCLVKLITSRADPKLLHCIWGHIGSSISNCLPRQGWVWMCKNTFALGFAISQASSERENPNGEDPQLFDPYTVLAKNLVSFSQSKFSFQKHLKQFFPASFSLEAPPYSKRLSDACQGKQWTAIHCWARDESTTAGMV